MNESTTVHFIHAREGARIPRNHCYSIKKLKPITSRFTWTSKQIPTRFLGIIFLFGLDATSDSNAGTGLLAVGDVSVDGSPGLLALSVVAVVAADA